MSYFTTQEVGNPMQTIKYVELPRFQPILKHKFNFVGSLFTLKTFIGDFFKIWICDKMRALFIFQIIDYA